MSCNHFNIGLEGISWHHNFPGSDTILIGLFSTSLYNSTFQALATHPYIKGQLYEIDNALLTFI